MVGKNVEILLQEQNVLLHSIGKNLCVIGIQLALIMIVLALYLIFR